MWDTANRNSTLKYANNYVSIMRKRLSTTVSLSLGVLYLVSLIYHMEQLCCKELLVHVLSKTF